MTALNVKKMPDFDKNLYIKVFEVADYKSEIEITENGLDVKKMPDLQRKFVYYDSRSLLKNKSTTHFVHIKKKTFNL